MPGEGGGLSMVTTESTARQVRDLDTPPGSARVRARPGHLKLCFLSPLGYGLYRPDAGLRFGGAELQFFLLARHLAAEADVEVVVLTTVESDPGVEVRGPLTLVKRRARHRLARHRTLRAGTLLRASWDYATALRDMYRLLRDLDADVYLHSGAGVEVGAYAVIARLLRRRFVYVVASEADVRDPCGLVTGALRRLYPLGLRLADAVVCRTRDQQAWLRRRYGRASALIKTGHPTAAVLDQPRSGILWVGRVHPLKQPHHFLDVAEQLGAEPCVMAAMHDPAHEELWRSVRRRASELANVTLCENVPWREVGALFARAKLLVNTSTYEGFPNTFVEAGMHGTPIVSLAVDPDRVLAEHGIGRCAGGSLERLVAEVRTLCRSEPSRAACARRARAYAVEHHDIQHAARAFKRLAVSLATS